MEAQITLRLPRHLLRVLGRAATRAKVSRSALIRQILEERFAVALAVRKERPVDRIRDLIGSLQAGPPRPREEPPEIPERTRPGPAWLVCCSTRDPLWRS
jgi:hypothetical protein